jgi:hypothetical protein
MTSIILANITKEYCNQVTLVEHFNFFTEKIGEKCPLFFTLFFTEKASEKLITFAALFGFSQNFHLENEKVVKTF